MIIVISYSINSDRSLKESERKVVSTWSQIRNCDNHCVTWHVYLLLLYLPKVSYPMRHPVQQIQRLSSLRYSMINLFVNYSYFCAYLSHLLCFALLWSGYSFAVNRTDTAPVQHYPSTPCAHFTFMRFFHTGWKSEWKIMLLTIGFLSHL